MHLASGQTIKIMVFCGPKFYTDQMICLFSKLKMTPLLVVPLMKWDFVDYIIRLKNISKKYHNILRDQFVRKIPLRSNSYYCIGSSQNRRVITLKMSQISFVVLTAERTQNTDNVSFVTIRPGYTYPENSISQKSG